MQADTRGTLSTIDDNAPMIDVMSTDGKTIMKVQNVETLNLNDSGVLLPVESQDE